MTVLPPRPSSRRLPGLHRQAGWTLLFLSAGLLLCAGLSSSQAQVTLLQRNYDKDGLSRIEVESVFSPSVTKGLLPIRVTIRNSFAIDRTWNLDFNYGGSYGDINYRSNFTVSAKAGEEVVRELLVPVPSTIMTTTSGYRQMNVTASSRGLPSERQSQSYNFATDWPDIAISKRLADRNMNRLNNEVSSRSGASADDFGAIFQPEELPGDWRAYTCLDALMISEAEWQDVPPSAKLAILEWNRLGGRLDFYTQKPKPVDFLKVANFIEAGGAGTSVNRGIGQIRAFNWNGQDLEAKKICDQVRTIPNRATYLANNYKRDWPLLGTFGSKNFNAILVVLLLIAFGIIVGPVNLFVLAKPGKRHKLFITTPIISLVASLLILALILLSDGIGGAGIRRVLANLEPDPNEKRLYVIQEQISRTGVLLGSGFRISDPVFLSPVMIPPSQWNRLDTSRAPVASYSLTGDTYRGDWYQSRSEQGHYLQSVRPTRSRIELQEESSADGATPPRLFSSLEFKLDEFYYRDRHGLCWKATAGNIAGGQEITLEQVEKSDLDAWWKKQTATFSAPIRAMANKLTNERDHFFAISSSEDAGFTETLGTIRWKDDLAVVHGNVLPAGLATSTPDREADKNPDDAN